MGVIVMLAMTMAMVMIMIIAPPLVRVRTAPGRGPNDSGRRPERTSLPIAQRHIRFTIRAAAQAAP